MTAKPLKLAEAGRPPSWRHAFGRIAKCDLFKRPARRKTKPNFAGKPFFYFAIEVKGHMNFECRTYPPYLACTRFE
jgi:hypothetical protein